MKKIIVLSMALFASVLLLNQAKAATGTLSLAVVAGSGSCAYGTDINLGTKSASYSSADFDGDYPTAWNCEDLQGTQSAWNLTIASSNLVNASNANYTIPNTSIFVSTTSSYLSGGNCPILAGTTSYTALNTAQSILGKTNVGGLGQGAICKIIADTVSLRVTTAANQAVGTYTGTLTIDVPNFN